MMMMSERAAGIQIVILLAAVAAALFVYSRHLSDKIVENREWYDAAAQVRNSGGTITYEYITDDGATAKRVFHYRKDTDED